jgi:hypothetical protein
LEPIKANRLARPAPIRIKRTVTTDPAHPLMWQAAHLSLDTGNDVVDAAVLRVARWIMAAQARPTSNEVERGDHGLSRDQARAALGTGRARGWLDTEDGPRRSRLWQITDAGRARLALEARG